MTAAMAAAVGEGRHGGREGEGGGETEHDGAASQRSREGNSFHPNLRFFHGARHPPRGSCHCSDWRAAVVAADVGVRFGGGRSSNSELSSTSGPEGTPEGIRSNPDIAARRSEAEG